MISPTAQAILTKGRFAAAWITASPHEWRWNQEEQEAMAHTILILDGELRDLRRKYDLAVPPYTRGRCIHKPKYCKSKLCKRCYDRLAKKHERTKLPA